MSRVGLVFGGRSTEHRVSVDSARNVDSALREAGHEVVPLAITPEGVWVAPSLGRRVLQGAEEEVPTSQEPLTASLQHLLASGAEVVFPVTHGTWGEDGCLQGLCEMLDLPYTGPGVTTSAVAMDKLLTKRLVEAVGQPVVEYETVSRAELSADESKVLARVQHLGLPLFVKPTVGGSSVGVVRVARESELAEALHHSLEFDERLVVERCIVGRELECAVLGSDEIEASVIGEIRPAAEFYDYADKYLNDDAQLVAPAPLAQALSDEVRQRAAAAFAALGGWGMARVDFLLEEASDRLYLNEINTLPGFTDISMFPRLWELSGVPPAQLVDRLVSIALQRHAVRRSLDAGIKSWIAQVASQS